MDTITTETQFTSGFYAKRDIALTRGWGATVWDGDGREYIDCTGGIGVAAVGHCHPVVAASLAAQAARLITCQEMFYNDQRARFISRLAEWLPWEAPRIFLGNSGAEAVEAALKLARLSTGRSGVVGMMRGFHGRTLGALSATHKKMYRQPFAPLVPGFSHVPFNNVDRLAAAVTDETAAVILELVQGEGGVRPATAEFVRAARQICDERGALLIVDEVQTGYGRTGRFLACEHYDLQPDLLCLGKAMAGGVPMGAVGIGPHVQNIAPGLHGSTFGGNPLACAAANAVLDVFAAENLVERTAVLGEKFLIQLRAIPSPQIREVRGRGLLAAVELKQRAMPAVRALAGRGVLALTAGATVLRFLPPLVISEAELAEVTEAVTAVLAGE